jgi:hypothetical protein
MSRVLLAVSLVLLAAALILIGQATRYQYYSVVGPSWNAKADTEVDVRRIDRWAGTLQVWVCRDVDTNRVADVPPPPGRPPDFGSPQSAEAVARTGQYYVALSMWRSAFPSVDAQNLHFTKPVCRWEAAR